MCYKKRYFLLPRFFTRIIHKCAGSRYECSNSCEVVKRLEKLSRIDDLTGIGNRREFRKSISMAVGSSSRYEIPMSLILMDIDHFKKYNDTYGHKYGDKCLRVIADVISCHCKRSTDVVTRIGGEEFAIILLGNGLEEASKMAENIRLSLSRCNVKHRTSPSGDKVTLSIGVTEFIDGDTSGSIYSRADNLMYQSKENGRDRITIG